MKGKILKMTIGLFITALPLLLTWGCVEEFQAKTERFENLLVVDALVTDELKKHKVILTRVFRFEEEAPEAETNATVKVVDGQGAEYLFEETEPGVYISQLEFAAQQDMWYSLEIRTAAGKDYKSKDVVVPKSVPITDLRAERLTNDKGEEGVGIFLDNTAAISEPTFFRYEYEETYKIIAPKWDPFDFEVVHYIACDSLRYQVDIKTHEEERRVCYASAKSSNVVQASTIDLGSADIKNKEIRFISRENYILSHRYSINVNQFSQTQDAFSFYERLGDFSSSENLFSQIQPGFLEGNILSMSDKEEGVLGYFEVASVSTKRVYFNYTDLFPDEELPPYIINCSMGNPQLYTMGYHCADFRVCDGACESPLIEAILAGIISYAATNEENTNQPYFTWPRACGDCTEIGSNVVPEFWEE